jgi:hypothetical protein
MRPADLDVYWLVFWTVIAAVAWAHFFARLAS